MTEYEKKFILSFNEFNILKNSVFCGAKEVLNENFYYDTSNLDMYREKITCRIRKNGKRMCATVKSHICGESEKNIERSAEVYCVSEMFPFKRQDLFYKGVLVTRRKILYPQDGVRLMLDENLYLETTDWELEAEYDENCGKEAENAVVKLCECLTDAGAIKDKAEFLIRAGKGKSKSERFFEKYINLRKA